MTGKSVIISAPSGAGKTTIVHKLIDAIGDLRFSVSATSRSPRHGEVDGTDYHFMTVEEFKQRIEHKEFIEWEEVYQDQFYGTLKAEVNRIWKDGHHVIFDVDVEGGVSLKTYFGEQALSIFIEPPSLEALAQRLNSRGTESEESMNRRLSKAEHELTYSDKYDVVVVNDDLDAAVARTLSIVNEFLGS